MSALFPVKTRHFIFTLFHNLFTFSVGLGLRLVVIKANAIRKGIWSKFSNYVNVVYEYVIGDERRCVVFLTDEICVLL